MLRCPAHLLPSSLPASSTVVLVDAGHRALIRHRSQDAPTSIALDQDRDEMRDPRLAQCRLGVVHARSNNCFVHRRTERADEPLLDVAEYKLSVGMPERGICFVNLGLTLEGHGGHLAFLGQHLTGPSL